MDSTIHTVVTTCNTNWNNHLTDSQRNDIPLFRTSISTALDNSPRLSGRVEQRVGVIEVEESDSGSEARCNPIEKGHGGHDRRMRDLSASP